MSPSDGMVGRSNLLPIHEGEVMVSGYGPAPIDDCNRILHFILLSVSGDGTAVSSHCVGYKRS